MAFNSIGELLTSPAYRSKLDYVIDNTHAFLTDPNKEQYYKDRGQTPDPEVMGQFGVFDKNAPYREADDFDVLEFIIKRNMSIASLTPKGGEIPTTSMGELLKVDGGMAKMTLSHIYDEHTMEKMIKLRNATVLPDMFVDLIFGNVNDLQTKIFKLGNVLTAQAWYQGRVLFTDPRTGVSLDIQYDTWPALFPAPLQGGACWDQHDTATGIQDLIDHSLAFYKINGYYPACYKMSIDLINHLLRQRSTTNFAQSMGLINSNPNSGSSLPVRVTRKILKQMCDETPELPNIEQWDAQYELEVEPGVSERYPYLPSHSYCVVQPKSIERLWGLTIESGMGQKGFGTRHRTNTHKPKGGVFLKANEDLRLSPPECRAFGVGRMIPFNADGRRLAGRKVVAA